MQECISLADECNIPNEHVTHVLEYLHSNLGTVLYYDKVNSLSDYIIVNPNVLFSSISRFVTLSFMGSGEHHNTDLFCKTNRRNTCKNHAAECTTLRELVLSLINM